MTHLGKIAAQILADKFLHMKIAGQARKEAWRPRPTLEILGSGPLNHKLHGKRREQGLHIVCTHIPRGKSWDRVELFRRGKRC